jgi:hypothetical protein
MGIIRIVDQIKEVNKERSIQVRALELRVFGFQCLYSSCPPSHKPTGFVCQIGKEDDYI